MQFNPNRQTPDTSIVVSGVFKVTNIVYERACVRRAFRRYG